MSDEHNFNNKASNQGAQGPFYGPVTFNQNGDGSNTNRDREEETALQTYFDRMQELLLDRGLKESEPGAHVRSVARARTLAVLRSIQDSRRKGSVVKFLYESGLIDKEKTVVNLEDAFLHGVWLTLASLPGTNLKRVILQRGQLQRAQLENANLQLAFLGEAHLEGAFLMETDLQRAHLNNAFLSGAYLNGANLQVAFLREANLQGATLHLAWLQQAKLEGANLEGAILTGARLQGASLEGANLEGANLQEVVTDGNTNFAGARYNSETSPPPGGFPDSAIKVDA